MLRSDKVSFFLYEVTAINLDLKRADGYVKNGAEMKKKMYKQVS